MDLLIVLRGWTESTFLLDLHPWFVQETLDDSYKTIPTATRPPDDDQNKHACMQPSTSGLPLMPPPTQGDGERSTDEKRAVK